MPLSKDKQKEKEDLEEEIAKKVVQLATLINVLVQHILILLSICNADEFGHSFVFKRKKTNLCS